jgi:hypothetical protein
MPKLPTKVRGKRRAYLLTFDRDDFIDYTELHNNLVELPEVTTWWHYIKSSYILISSYSSSVVSKELMKLAPNKRFLLIEINLNNKNGWLPLDAWTWLNNQKDIINNQ